MTNQNFIYFLERMKPEWMSDLKFFLRSYLWRIVAWWKGYKWKELHWDYEYVSSKEKGEEKLKEYWYKEWDTLITNL